MTALIAGLAGGLAGWTLLEYVIHRAGHLRRGRLLITREHRRHHRDILYFTPLPTKIMGALPVLGGLALGMTAACGLAAATGFTMAVAGGWTAYEWLHQSIHVHGPRGPYTRWAARHHLSHHFGRCGGNLGVTTPLWDVLLGSHEPPTRVAVPKAILASIPWLASAVAAGGDRPPFLADYDVG